MSSQSQTFIEPLFVGYLLVFGATAVACFASVARARRIEDPDTRRGLVALLVLTGVWSSTHVAFLAAPTTRLRVAVYTVGLIVGFATVGPWLYFCSAYTGRSLHRNLGLQRLALVVFLVVVAVKLTNPLHGLYFTTETVASPFPHLAVRNGTLHWLTMGLSYALASVGYFMLVELFVQVDHDTRPLFVLVGLTGLPVVLDVVGATSPYLVDVPYEPLGVAAFALGALFLFAARFETVQLTGGHDEPVVVLNDEGHVRDFNRSLTGLFPDVADGDVLGRPIEEVLPQVAAALDSGTSIAEVERDGETRYYQLTSTDFGTRGSRLGGLVGFTDVTHREQYRRRLERQNERLESFANTVSHDLRNPLGVAQAHIEFAREERDDEHLEAADAALDRIEALIEDLLTLAREGEPIDETAPVRLSALVEECWTLVDTAEAELVVESDLVFVADADRLRQLFENLFRNSAEHGGRDVTVTIGALEGDDGFYVADDGPGIPDDERERVFDSGYTTAETGTGFGLAIVEEIVGAHGWAIRISDTERGTRFEISGVRRVGRP